MVEKRRFHRIRLASKCSLDCNNAIHEGRLENLSLNGALVSFKGSILVRPGNRGTFSFHVDGDAVPLRFEVEVVHSGFSMVGVKFIDLDAGTKARLAELMERLTAEPEKLREELALARRDD
ncbi:MAG TPA: PilZ domain-containing protein [Geobacteraceae bacterium]|nr:PilZ domain-containing protein [Geobacteraceae bacterium]